MEDYSFKQRVGASVDLALGYLRSVCKIASVACIGCFLTTPILAASPDNAQPATPTVGDLYRAFETVVFGNEFGSKKARKKVLKWDKPLRISIQAFDDREIDHGNGIKEVVFGKIPLTQFQVKVVEKNLSILERLTKIETEDYKKSGKAPNLTINYVPRFHLGNPTLAPIDKRRLRRLASQQGCYFILWEDTEASAIKKAVIVINSDHNERQISHCVLEEMTQTLGLPNDNNVAWPSIFSNTQKSPALSRGDKIILRTLYAPQIKTGMAKKDVMRRALKLIKKFDAELPAPEQ